jgi:beta-ureidopropionase / N-carbamoyl-L-amino-acid hydrolase
VTRRRFLTAAAAALAWPPVAPGAQTARVEGARLQRRLEHLSTFGRPAGGTFASGVSRVAYSDADVAARAWLLGEVRTAGFSPRIDPAGNVFVRSDAALAGSAGSGPPPILFGSHIDSVPGGGNFDGDLGTLAALEVLQAVRTAGLTLRHPLEMVLWAHEESTAFGRGTACSRIVAGDLKAGDLDQEWNGVRRRDALTKIGGDPTRIEEAVRPKGAWHAYVELHIEQGGTLDRTKVPIGVVDGIVAIHRYDVVVEGFANHAGTTEMDRRQDALVAASQLVLAVREIATARAGRQVGTVGHLEVQPNSPNVIPGRVRLSVEFRDLSVSVLDGMGASVRARAEAIGRDTDTRITMTLATTNPAAPAHPGVKAAIREAVDGAGLPARELPSGAGHDAQMIAALCPMGMIFVPSVAGISHSPRELTSWDDCTRGAQVLLDTVLELDRRDSV